jgi:hypothetical protein
LGLRETGTQDNIWTKRGKVTRLCVGLIEGDRTMFGRKRRKLARQCSDEREENCQGNVRMKKRKIERTMFGRKRGKVTGQYSDEREEN